MRDAGDAGAGQQAPREDTGATEPGPSRELADRRCSICGAPAAFGTDYCGRHWPGPAGAGA
jgi:hypothetical protein